MQSNRKGLKSMAAAEFVNGAIRTAYKRGSHVVTLREGSRVTADQLVRAALKRGLTAESNGNRVLLAKQREQQAEAA